jgi:hypothetical protein
MLQEWEPKSKLQGLERMFQDLEPMRWECEPEFQEFKSQVRKESLKESGVGGPRAQELEPITVYFSRVGAHVLGVGA